MGIQVAWDDADQTIIRWDFEADWNWDDFRAAFDTSMALGNSVGYRVDVLPYVANTVKMPVGALGEFNRLHRQLPPHVGLIVITGGNSLNKAIIAAFARVNRINSWRTVSTLEAAYALIQADRLAQQAS